MGQRPAVYESFVDRQLGITIDMRVFAPAPSKVNRDKLLEEVGISYINLYNQILEKWPDDKRK